VTRFENTFAAPLLRMKDHWMSDPAISGGGSFIDTGCHSLDLFLHLIGRGRVMSAIAAHAWPGRGESSATVLMRSDDGVAGVIQSGWTEPARFTVRVVGTAGALVYDYDRATVLRFTPNEGEEQIIEAETHEVRFQRQLEAFAEAASGPTPALRPASFAEALWTAQRVDEARQLASQ
jgi:predicted dehydrogenase